MISSAVGLKIFEIGFKKMASMIKDLILRDKDAQESFKMEIEDAVVSRMMMMKMKEG